MRTRHNMFKGKKLLLLIAAGVLAWMLFRPKAAGAKGANTVAPAAPPSSIIDDIIGRARQIINEPVRPPSTPYTGGSGTNPYVPNRSGLGTNPGGIGTAPEPVGNPSTPTIPSTGGGTITSGSTGVPKTTTPTTTPTYTIPNRGGLF